MIEHYYTTAPSHLDEYAEREEQPVATYHHDDGTTEPLYAVRFSTPLKNIQLNHYKNHVVIDIDNQLQTLINEGKVT